MNLEVPKLELKMEPAPFQNIKARRQKDFNWFEITDYSVKMALLLGNFSDALDSKFKDYDQRINNQLVSSTFDKEVADARLPENSDISFGSLRDRLNDSDKKVLNIQNNFETIYKI